MPLGFQSINHGVIAFGFFNIDTDLLLMEHYFLFADEFCRWVARLEDLDSQGPFETAWEVHHIDRNDIGDLMGAIHDVHYSGFIGEVYRRFPFPKRPEDFKQKPEGSQNRSIIETIMAGYVRKIPIPFRADPERETISMAEYLFTKDAFHQLIRYVWLGGYPRWKDGFCPGYVTDMKDHLHKSQSWLFSGLSFNE